MYRWVTYCIKEKPEHLVFSTRIIKTKQPPQQKSMDHPSLCQGALTLV